MTTGKKACIIGAGVAGIATAIRLAIAGFSVEVFEKNSYPGGKLSDFEKDGFHFDAGPSLFTQPRNIEELFTLAGENMADHFSYRPMDTACRYLYEDGTLLDAYTDMEKLTEELSSKTGESAGAIKSYLASSAHAYNNIANIFLNFSLHKRSTLRKAPVSKALSAVKRAYLFSTFNKYNSSSFTSPHIQQLFNRYATYNGSNPYRAPAMLSIIPHLELNDGTFYPAGGMISVTKTLYRLAVRKGVKFHFDAPVQRIIRAEQKVTGVVVNNKNIFADVVVSNMDVYFTYKHLLQDVDAAAKLLRRERSSSAIIFYWGINKEFPGLGLHNILFSNDYAAEFADIFRNRKISKDPTVYINITSKCEREVHAPPGQENWFVMINAPADSGQNWTDLIATCRSSVVKKINRMLKTDIEKHIVFEQAGSPVTIAEQTASYMGSLYGTSSNTKLSAFLRHPNFSRRIQNLYFVGGSVHPGGGIPLCLKSAKIATGIIEQDARKRKKR